MTLLPISVCAAIDPESALPLRRFTANMRIGGVCAAEL
jgi:hypothetical protein